VKVPSQLHVPDGVRVRTFPTHDDGRFIWIWPGNAAAADLTPPPRLPALTEPAWSHFGGTTTIEAGLLLLHEHLLDLTHFWVGLPGSSPGELSELPPLSEIEVTETTVGYRRTHPPAPLVGWEAVATGLDPSARFSHRDSATFASPALQVMTWEIDGGDDTVFDHVIVRALTPETDSRTKVTWLTGYNYADRQPHAIHTLRTVVADTIQQDASMVEMVQANLTPGAVSTPGSHRAAGMVALLADTAALTATRIVRAMIDRETGRSR
jgi:vanillate O-demethylase monooxygenase subunit